MLFILLVSLLVIGIIGIMAYLAPNNYEVTRSIVIDKPFIGVFDYLKYIKNQDHWSPWKKKDIDIKQEYIGTDGDVGFIAKWQGNSEVGMGEQEIIEIVENKRIVVDLRFFKPLRSFARAVLKVEDFGKMRTKVTWGFWGKNKFPSNIFMLFYNMDKVIGKDFEDGLSNLKKVLEKE